LEIIKQSYGFTISNDGEVYGLVAGDQGYEFTNIVIPIEDLEAWAKYNYRDAEITRLREELNAYKIREKAPSSEDDR
jgi:DNA/RNA-binding domain of Phe-tRNA-synthetase-like protein